MSMTMDEIIGGNRIFVINILMTLDILPSNRIYDVLVKQLVRSSISIDPNHRAACRAKSTSDFINKLKIVEEERADGNTYYLDFFNEVNERKSKKKLKPFRDESNQWGSIYVASLMKMNDRNKDSKNYEE